MTSRAVASRYARALFDVLFKESKDRIEPVQEDLQRLADLLSQYPALAAVLGNPAIPASKKRGVAQSLLEKLSISGPLAKLVVLIADRDRLMLLPDVAATYRERVMDYRNIARGEVTTAVPLAPEQVRALETELRRLTGRTVVLETKVDPNIIGGVVARIGSTVYDGSVTTQLEKLKQSLIEAAQ